MGAKTYLNRIDERFRSVADNFYTLAVQAIASGNFILAKENLEKVVALPDVRARLTDLGLTVGYMNPQQLDQRERAYTRVWSRIIADSDFQPQ